MRSNWTPALRRRLHRADRAAGRIVTLEVTGNADIRQNKDDWLSMDTPLTGLDIRENGSVRLNVGAAIVIEKTTSDTQITDLGTSSPWIVAKIVWGDPLQELSQIIANLDPVFGGAQAVVTWVLQARKVIEVSQLGLAGEYFVLQDITDRIQVTAPTVAGDVTFPLTNGPRTVRVGDAPIGGGSTYRDPITYVYIWGIRADGTPASNIAWNAQTGADVVTGGNTLSGRELVEQAPGEIVEALSTQPVPRLSIREPTAVQKTVGFTGAGNRINLGSGAVRAIDDSIGTDGVDMDVATNHPGFVQWVLDTSPNWIEYLANRYEVKLGHVGGQGAVRSTGSVIAVGKGFRYRWSVVVPANNAAEPGLLFRMDDPGGSAWENVGDGFEFYIAPSNDWTGSGLASTCG